jgi:hypothetical protein
VVELRLVSDTERDQVSSVSEVRRTMLSRRRGPPAGGFLSSLT